LPIVLTHGWPATFLEFREIIGPLADPVAYGGDPEDAFDVVVPSLPGFGFSPAPLDPRTTKKTVAHLWRALMVDVLGYERFVAHGGDIGCGVTTRLGLHHADVVDAIHLIHLFESPHLGEDAAPLTDAENAYLGGLEEWSTSDGAYRQVQRTKPYTLGPALNDSPAGLAAWIVEKYHSWGDTGGKVESRFSREEILTTLTVYWVTQTITSSIEVYYANHNWHPPFARGERVEVPTGVSLFPNENIVEPEPPREWGERLYNIAHWRSFPSGGHFPALEEPALLVEELREFFRVYR
jgi:pimeloyl-ACP methyl ester carboxylesterase